MGLAGLGVLLVVLLVLLLSRFLLLSRCWEQTNGEIIITPVERRMNSCGSCPGSFTLKPVGIDHCRLCLIVVRRGVVCRLYRTTVQRYQSARGVFFV